MDNYDPDEIRGLLEQESRRRRTASAAAVAEWLFPLWKRYATAEASAAVRTQLDNVWSCVMSGEGDVSGAEEVLDPWTPDDDSDAAALAENALSAVAYAARSWEAEDAADAEYGVRQLYSAADHVVESVLPEEESLDPDERERLGDALLEDALQGIDDAISGARDPAHLRADFSRRGGEWAERVPRPSSS